MQLVVADIETFWSVDHSLTKMSPIAYVMHPDTEIISLALKVGSGETQVAFGEANVLNLLNSVNWDDALVVAHNMSGFDAMILAWRFGIRPKMWGCTLAMARPIHGVTVGGSLSKLVTHYGIGVKDSTALVQTKGKHLKDFTPEEIKSMGVYNKADTDQCAALFHILKKHFNARELWHIDTSIRMLVEPQFVVDRPMLEVAASIERVKKHEALLELYSVLRADPVQQVTDAFDGVDRAEYVRSTVASSAKFADLLRSRGVEVPMKPSPTNPEKTTPALAKTDEAFIALQDHEDPVVALAARVRLDVKSTLLETRIQAFLDASEAAGGKLPIPLHYCGADTTGRWSGWAYNPQNLPRIVVGKPKSSDALRNCMKVPKGCVVGVADLSGIELRVNHFLWKVPSSMALFQASPDKADLYKDFAARLYNVLLEEVAKEQRQIGKVAHLGLGFGAGPGAFRKVAKTMGGVDISETEAMSVTYKWREEYMQIVEGWKTCHSSLPYILNGDEAAIDPWGLTHTCREGIRLPSGRLIRYPELRRERVDGKSEWWYGSGRKTARIYAGKIDENIVQALARDIIADNCYEFWRMTGLRPQLMVHDELVYVMPEGEAEAMLGCLQKLMRTPPKWWPELVTWSEGDIAGSYGAAK